MRDSKGLDRQTRRVLAASGVEFNKLSGQCFVNTAIGGKLSHVQPAKRSTIGETGGASVGGGRGCGQVGEEGTNKKHQEEGERTKIV